MKAFTTHTGLVLPLDRADVDTDQIIPKQFLKRVERTGFGQFLFYDWRFINGEKDNPEFILNHSDYKDASILMTRDNFGCGSSREHAPWALLDYGFQVILAPSFADIFYNNCLKNAVLPIVLKQEEIDALFQKNDPFRLKIDLENQNIEEDQGDWKTTFQIDSFHRECLLNGWNDIDLTLKNDDKISKFENTHLSYL